MQQAGEQKWDRSKAPEPAVHRARRRPAHCCRVRADCSVLGSFLVRPPCCRACLRVIVKSWHLSTYKVPDTVPRTCPCINSLHPGGRLRTRKVRPKTRGRRCQVLNSSSLTAGPEPLTAMTCHSLLPPQHREHAVLAHGWLWFLENPLMC